MTMSSQNAARRRGALLALPLLALPLLALPLLAIAIGASAADGDGAAAEDARIAREYAATIRPLLERNCFACHDQEHRKGDLCLSALTVPITEQDLPHWIDAKNVLDVSSMPPRERKRQPTRAERDRLVAWIGDAIAHFEEVHRETHGDTLVRRITKRAYVNMIATLLDVPCPKIALFPDDGTVRGFDTVGSGLYLTRNLYELYLQNAREALDLAIQTGPRPGFAVVREQDQAIGTARNALSGPQRLLRAIEAKEITSWPSDNDVGELANTICAYYQVGSTIHFHELEPGWWDDPGCVAAIRQKVKELTESVDHLEQARSCVRASLAGIHNALAGNQQVFFTAPVAGYYVIRAQVWNNAPGTVMPGLFTLDGNPVLHFLPDASPRHPRFYEARVFVTAGNHQANVDLDWDVMEIDAHRRAFPPTIGLSRDRLEVSGPYFASWPPPATQRIFFRGVDAAPTREYAEAIVARFMARACADIVDPRSVPRYADLVMAQYASSRDFVAAVKHGLMAILASPQFLYLDEDRRSDPGHRRALTGPELARRLAYLLWSDLPDEALAAHARSGDLLEDGILRLETQRMLRDPRSRAFREAFTTQWLGLDKLAGIPFPVQMFPAYDDYLKIAAVEESVGFFSEVLDRDLGLANFIDSDFAVIDQRLAQLYGIPGVTGSEFRRVELPPGSHRGGLITQASVLMMTSNGMIGSPVKRGTFILEHLLDDPPGSPPPNVPALDRVRLVREDGQPFTPRERLAMHREVGSCARCHDRIDPPGLALEHFDALGRWRERESLLAPDPAAKEKTRLVERDIEIAGALADGSAFKDSDELKRRLLEHQDAFARCFVEAAMTYALGRELQGSDRPVVERIAAGAAQGGHGLRSLLEDVVLSEPFRTK